MEGISMDIETKDIKKAESRYKIKVVILFLLMMMDYVITYIGIKGLMFIEEANPFMVWLFDIPFGYGLIIRLVYVSLIAFLCMYIYKMKYKYYNAFINIGIGINMVVF